MLSFIFALGALALLFQPAILRAETKTHPSLL